MLPMLVLFALVPEGAEGNSRCMQPGQLTKKSLDRLPMHTSKLHSFVEGLFSDYGSRMANKIEQLLQHLQTV